MDQLTQERSGQEGSGLHGGKMADRWKEPYQPSLDGGFITWGQTGLSYKTAQERLTRLVHTIEADIIPRLVDAHRNEDADTLHKQLKPVLCQDEVEEFARLVLLDDERHVSEHIAGLRSKGLSIDSIYLDLLAPAARHLGYLWTEDLCDFTEVTVGLGRLQQIMRALSPQFGTEVEHPACGRRVLLVPAPGEQHTFGLSMVAEFFARAGWDVVGGAHDHDCDAVDIVSNEWFDVIGISVGSETRLDWLKAGISAARRGSRNPEIGVMVGGPIFTLHPEYVAKVGADATAVDGRHAPIEAEQLMALQVRLAQSTGGIGVGPAASR
jgi:MerR family transcriptional regulator, light-induced transcriptional regulator